VGERKGPQTDHTQNKLNSFSPIYWLSA
jgi:hypothetical protein